MVCVNKIFLIGNLTRDPEMRTTPNGFSVCSFGLAVNRRRKVEGQPEVDFFNVTAWRQLGENCAKYLQKGRKVCVVGALQIRTYDAQDGTKRTVVDVEADDVEFMPVAAPGGEGRPAVPAAAFSAAPPAPMGFQPAETGFTQVDEDELPF
ncbi:single-stranded DNA-binding protein [Clostridia bacterium]|nr:single-stranded DNA-binding protein [Clostridia bacterium]